jgi:hypothetical protein
LLNYPRPAAAKSCADSSKQCSQAHPLGGHITIEDEGSIEDIKATYSDLRKQAREEVNTLLFFLFYIIIEILVKKSVWMHLLISKTYGSFNNFFQRLKIAVLHR